MGHKLGNGRPCTSRLVLAQHDAEPSLRILHEPKLQEPADLRAPHVLRSPQNASLLLQPAWQGKGLSRLEKSRGDPTSLGVGERGRSGSSREGESVSRK